MDERRALYFGCYGHIGHYLYERVNGRVVNIQPPAEMPWGLEHCDARLLKNSKERDEPTGFVRWTCGGQITNLWFAFYWWDRSVDRRSNSNSGFYVTGFGPYGPNMPEKVGEVFEYACSSWPEVVDRQVFPLLLWQSEGHA